MNKVTVLKCICYTYYPQHIKALPCSFEFNGIPTHVTSSTLCAFHSTFKIICCAHILLMNSSVQLTKQTVQLPSPPISLIKKLVFVSLAFKLINSRMILCCLCQLFCGYCIDFNVSTSLLFGVCVNSPEGIVNGWSINV